MEDLNRPEGFYGEVYDRETRSKDRVVGEHYYPFTRWESDVVSALEEINKKLGL